jgi:uncharacterized protein (DUF2062 family)
VKSRLLNPLRRWLLRLAGVRDTPQALARGLAIGFFFAASPIWGTQIVLALVSCQLLRGNKVLAVSMTALSNPLTALPLYSLCYLLGSLVLTGNAHPPPLGQLTTLQGFLSLGSQTLGPLLLGSTLIGLGGGVALYFAATPLLAALRRRLSPEA